MRVACTMRETSPRNAIVLTSATQVARLPDQGASKAQERYVKLKLAESVQIQGPLPHKEAAQAQVRVLPQPAGRITQRVVGSFTHALPLSSVPSGHIPASFGGFAVPPKTCD